MLQFLVLQIITVFWEIYKKSGKNQEQIKNNIP